jgi:hypothetical protein
MLKFKDSNGDTAFIMDDQGNLKSKDGAIIKEEKDKEDHE